MSPEAHGLILPVGQSFVPTAQLPSVTSPPETRRAMVVFGDGSGANPGSGYEDVCCRMGFTLPVTPTRCRFRIRNSDIFANNFIAQSITNTGIWWGTPNIAQNFWAGDFTVAPTQVYAGSTSDFGTTELVTPWFTPPAGAVAYAFQGVSMGFTCGTDGKMNIDEVPGWTWHSATNTGQASSAGNAAVPTGGTASPYIVPFDIRMEYEFVGRNQIGWVLGTSLTNGFLQTTGTAAPYGHMGPDNMWTQMAGNRLGHNLINGGIGGGSLASYTTSTSRLSWTRFNDPTTGTLFGGTFPDYAVIDMGINDSSTNALAPLATFQSNYQTLIGQLQSAGFSKIVACTVPAGFLTEYFGSLTTFQTGVLASAVTAGSGKTSISLNAIGTTYPVLNYASAPGGGPVATTQGGRWYDAANTQTNSVWLELPASGIAEGPFTITAIASGVMTIVSSTFAFAHAQGAPVLATREGFRQNYNHWLRQLPPGIVGVIDFAKVSEASGLPPIYKNWYYYSQADDIHPNTPALYNAMAQEFTAGMVGL